MNTNKSFAKSESENNAVPSLDEFMRELEQREKSLSISSNDEVVEIEAYYEFDKPDNSNYVTANSGNSQTNLEANPAGNNPPKGKNSNSALETFDLQKQIKDLKKEREDLMATIRRRQSDFDSYRNRTERERNEMFLKVLSNLANRMLPVIDNMNRALDSAKNSNTNQTPEFENFLEGVILVSQHFQDVLAEMGIKPILSVGKPFDPHFHEAVAMEKSEEFPPNTVIAELIRGYCIGETVLRPAMVKVSN